MITLTNKTDYSTPEARKRLAYFISGTIEGGSDSGFIPYLPNEHDDRYWTLDSGNNWKLMFPEDEPNHFTLIYRYGDSSPEYELALFGWLQVRISAEKVS